MVKLIFSSKQFDLSPQHPTLEAIVNRLNQRKIGGLTWNMVAKKSPFAKNLVKVDWLEPALTKADTTAYIIGFKEDELVSVLTLGIDLVDVLTKIYGNEDDRGLGIYLAAFHMIDLHNLQINPEYREQYLATEIIKAIWKPEIPLTAKPSGYLESFFKGKQGSTLNSESTIIFSTLPELFEVYNRVECDTSSRLTPLEFMNSQAFDNTYGTVSVFLRSLIDGEPLLVELSDGRVISKNVIPLNYVDGHGYIYRYYEEDIAVGLNLTLYELLDRVGCQSGLLCLDENITKANPYKYVDTSEYPIFRMVTSKLIKQVLDGKLEGSELYNTNYDPLKAASRVFNKFSEFSQVNV